MCTICTKEVCHSYLGGSGSAKEMAKSKPELLNGALGGGWVGQGLAGTSVIRHTTIFAAHTQKRFCNRLFAHPFLSSILADEKKGAATAGAGLYVDSFFATSACATPIHTIAIACGRNPLKLWVLQFFI